MAPGTYTVCITAEGLDGYESCFEVVVDEPESLSVTSKVDPEAKTVTLNLAGGKTYTIAMGGVEYSTLGGEVTLPVPPSATKLTVRTDKDCQGVYEERFELADTVIIYPNPVSNGEITVVLKETPTAPVRLQLSTSDGKIVYQEVVQRNEPSVKLDADALVPGMYILSMTIDRATSTYKIIKR